MTTDIFLLTILIILSNAGTLCIVCWLLYTPQFRPTRFGNHIHNLGGVLNTNRFTVQAISLTGMKLKFIDSTPLHKNLSQYISIHNKRNTSQVIRREISPVWNQPLPSNELIVAFKKPLSQDELNYLIDQDMDQYINETAWQIAAAPQPISLRLKQAS